MIKLSVIIPVYNDAKHIKQNIERIKERLDFLGMTYELIIIDDGSTDKTYAVLGLLPIKDKILALDCNMGKGAAFLYGCQEAQGEYICLMDSDAQIKITDLRPFFNLLNLYDADVVIGNKRHEYSYVKYSRMRWIVSNTYNFLCRKLFGFQLRDTQCGLKVFKNEVINKIIPVLVVKRFAFDLEILVALCENGVRIVDAPVSISKQYGYGSVNIKNIIQVFIDTIKIWIRKKRGLYIIHDPRELDTGE